MIVVIVRPVMVVRNGDVSQECIRVGHIHWMRTTRLALAQINDPAR
jgi:hypothetical protein